MNYKLIYDAIVERAKTTIREGYMERHHIIPKCLGGDDSQGNLVLLTAREHYLCHWLLAKHHNIKKLWNAFAMMSVINDRQERIKNSRVFERARIARTLAMTGDGNPMYGKPSACKSHTEETKQKIRLAKLGKKRDPFTRSPPSQETRDRISSANKGKVAHNKGIPANRWICPHCGKEGGGESNKTRWHFDNCKMKG